MLLSPYVKSKPATPQAFCRFGWEHQDAPAVETIRITPDIDRALNDIITRKENG